MAQIIIEIPDDVKNTINNYYMENFGYEIHTQLQNFIHHEWSKCNDYPSTPLKEQATPSIFNTTNSPILRIQYPDGTCKIKECSDYSECVDTMNELSKTGYQKEPIPYTYEEGVELPEYVQRSKGKYIIRWRDRTTFGTFKRWEDAVFVKEFLQEHNWDKKYQAKNLISKFNCTNRDASRILVQIARGEIDYED